MSIELTFEPLEIFVVVDGQVVPPRGPDLGTCLANGLDDLPGMALSRASSTAILPRSRP
jgi:hypothetical protein